MEATKFSERDGDPGELHPVAKSDINKISWRRMRATDAVSDGLTSRDQTKSIDDILTNNRAGSTCIPEGQKRMFLWLRSARRWNKSLGKKAFRL